MKSKTRFPATGRRALLSSAMPARPRLGAADWFIIVAGLALVAAIQIGASSKDLAVEAPTTVPAKIEAPDHHVSDAPDYVPRIFGAARRVEHRLQISLSVEAENAYRTSFLNRTYYGAFAVGEGGRWGYATGYSRQTAARAEALAQCGAGLGGCRIYADLFPVSSGGSVTTQDETLTFEQGRAFQDLQSGTGIRAFARALDGSWGAATGATAEDATGAAIRICKERQPDIGMRTFPHCEVMAVWQD